MRKEIIPAIIADDQKDLEKKIRSVKDYVSTLQLDFMDGKFVPTQSIDFNFSVPDTDFNIEAHLMVESPYEWAKKNLHKVDTLLFHYESKSNPVSVINYVKSENKRAGIVINPETPVSDIKDYLKDIDQVLVMTVIPGYYGSKFIPGALEKVKELRKISPSLDIEVDGGITDVTISLAYSAGANLFVSGSYIVKSNNPEKRIDELNKLIS